MARGVSVLLLATLLALSVPRATNALFHFAVIDEVMTSYGGDTGVQFVEIRMLAASQNFVMNSVLGAFDANGSYIGDVLIVPGNVLSGTNRRWIMATAAFQTASGLTPDFIIPAGLPTGGGMVCWGAPGISAPPPGSWDHTNPNSYVDCVAYGTYSGPGNFHIGTPTPLDGDGHSLVRVGTSNDNADDFECGDPATPQNNAGDTVSLAATVACQTATTTTTSTPGTTTTTSTTVPPGVLTADEAKCQQTTGFELGKLAFKAARSIAACDKSLQKGSVPAADCVPPYGGKTAADIASNEDKAASKIRKKCSDPEAKGKDACPECAPYGGAAQTCAANADAQVAAVLGTVDALVPLVNCDDAASPDGLTPAEATCRQTMAKSGGKFAFKDANCLKKCRADIQSGKAAAGSCTLLPDGSIASPNSKVANCRSKEEGKLIDQLDAKCADPPECVAVNFGGFPQAFVDAIKSEVAGFDPSTYCAE
jgi:hypothetical protein